MQHNQSETKSKSKIPKTSNHPKQQNSKRKIPKIHPYQTQAHKVTSKHQITTPKASKSWIPKTPNFNPNRQKLNLNQSPKPQNHPNNQNVKMIKLQWNLSHIKHNSKQPAKTINHSIKTTKFRKIQSAKSNPSKKPKSKPKFPNPKPIKQRIPKLNKHNKSSV